MLELEHRERGAASLVVGLGCRRVRMSVFVCREEVGFLFWSLWLRGLPANRVQHLTMSLDWSNGKAPLVMRVQGHEYRTPLSPSPRNQIHSTVQRWVPARGKLTGSWYEKRPRLKQRTLSCWVAVDLVSRW